MKTRSDVRLLASALFASLGLLPSACGGQSLREGDAGSGGDDTGGTPSNGGTSTTGGSVSIGGTVSTGGVGGAVPTGGVGSTVSTGGVSTGGMGGTVSTGGVGGTVPVNRFPCENPIDLVAGTSGYVLCDNGVKHRPSVETCSVALPRPEPLPDIVGAACSSDLECQDIPYGFCGMTSGGNVAPRACMRGCANDADCEPGAICECGQFVGVCVGATCTSDADCAEGFLCQTHERMPGCSVKGYACQAPLDACASDADCTAPAMCTAGYAGDQGRTCSPRTCTPGRPFFVEGALRTAPHASRSDWLSGESFFVPRELSPGLRERVGHFHAESAALEHASVASFARFTLGLLSLGAPAELVLDSVRAMGDEIEHARIVYELASHFLGHAVGPGALSTEGALKADVTLDELALATFTEGCVGETLGALEAREAAAHAVDPTLRTALGRIADDETRHAALAFRFVAWALERSGPELRTRLQAAFETARRELEAPCGGECDDELSVYGVLAEPTRRAIRRQALEHAVVPCMVALFQRADAGLVRAHHAVANA